MTSTHTTEVRDAFAGECRQVTETLRSVPAEAWRRPALGQWNLRELVAHLFRAVTRVEAYLDQPVPAHAVPSEPSSPMADRVTYWHMDLAGEAAAIAQRARRDAPTVHRPTAAADFEREWQAVDARVRSLPPDHLTSSLRGPMLLDEYLATRVVELVVHHMDVRAALDLPPESDVGAARLTMAVLEGLLGGPRPRNLGRTRFILAATGRVEVDDPRFPVLS